MEELVSLLTSLLMAAGLALVLVWGRPTAIERRGRNAWVGIRIPATLESDAAWVAGHRAAWPAVRLGCWAGVALLLASAVLVVLGGSPGTAGALTSTALLVALALILVGTRAAHRAAKRHLDTVG